MKKSFLILLTILAIALVFVSCEHSSHKDDDDDPQSIPLTIEFYDMGGKIHFTNAPTSLMYSIDGGKMQKLGSPNATIEVGDSQSVSIYASRPRSTVDSLMTIDCSGSDCYIYGNVMSLLYSDSFQKWEIAYKNAFRGMFKDNKNIKNHPDYDLYLPATEVRDYSYYEMFAGCTNLTRVPELPATTLGESCYEGMFRGCTKITSVPDLDATTLKRACYKDMFNSCTSLTSAENLELPATILAPQCYYQMFGECTNLTSTPKLCGEKMATECYANMFFNCEALKTAPELPSKELADRCYYGMFSDCSNLTKAPSELPATKLYEYCYAEMFRLCSKLTKVPDLPAETLATACYSSMFAGCHSLEVAPAIAATTVATDSCANMFEMCINMVHGPILYSKIINRDCYKKMFLNCFKLKSLVCLAVSIEENPSTDWMDGVPENGVLYVADGMQTKWPAGDDGCPTSWTIQVY